MNNQTRLINYDVLRQAITGWAASLSRQSDGAKRAAEAQALIALTAEEDEGGDAYEAAVRAHGNSQGLRQGMEAFDELRRQLEQGQFDAKPDAKP